MSKILEQIREENRKAIIMACNSESKSYGEALKMELGFGCELLIGDRVTIIVDIYDMDNNRYFKALDTKSGCILENELEYLTQEEILGKPLTLDRVLLLFKRKSLQRFHEFTYYDEFKLKDSDHIYRNSFQIWVKNKNFKVIAIFNWELTKPTLEMQTEEVQRSINKILMGNE